MLKPAQTEMGRKLDSDARFSVLGEARPSGHEYYDMDDEPCTFGRWAELFEGRTSDPEERFRIGATDIGRGWARVSTVWLGMNHSFWPNGSPLIYESMIFGGAFEDEQTRYPTRVLAERGHRRMVEMARRDPRIPLYGVKLNKRKFSSASPRSRSNGQ